MFTVAPESNEVKIRSDMQRGKISFLVATIPWDRLEDALQLHSAHEKFQDDAIFELLTILSLPRLSAPFAIPIRLQRSFWSIRRKALCLAHSMHCILTGVS